MADHQVLFFGCVAVTLTEVRVKDAVFPTKMQNNNGVNFFVRMAILPKEGNETEERMGEYVDSSMHPLKSAEMAEELLIPVMLERALPVSAVAGGLSLSYETPKQNNEKDHIADDNGTAVRGDNGHGMSVELHLEVAVARGTLQATIAHRKVIIESLLNIAHEKCGVVAAHVSADALRQCAVWGKGFSLPTTDKSCVLEETHEDDENDDDGVCSGMEVEFIVRALDMSEPLRFMLAAECEARNLLHMPKREIQTTFLLPALRLPYGALPLFLLHQHYRRFYEHFFNKTLNPSDQVAKLLSVDDGNIGACRWCALSVVDMRRNILGEEALAPLLATLYHCPSLSSLVLDQNSLGDFTCYWIAALFHKHRLLREVSLYRNNIHECGAEQLLRLTRRNKILTQLNVIGNPCSPQILQRIQRVTEVNQAALKKDPFNVISSLYDYAVSPNSFSPDIVKKALILWAMLSSSSLKAADSTLESKQPSLIPQCALAPLLNEVMRTVALEMSFLIQDHFIRMVFVDIETHWRATLSLQDEDGKPALEEDDGGRETGHGELRVWEGNDDEGEHVFPPVDVEELYSYSFLRVIVVTMRSMLREGDWAESKTVLQAIGRSQQAIGVTPEDYRVALKVFIRALTIVCGGEHADAENSAAFLQLLALGVRTTLGVQCHDCNK
ncbi:hypothetical protein C3747_144g114 [Trypanosoma cruzi]|uniref:Uncharacterized protein n=2 Tax=Trypanosoma cruzi TaxID=5693 RepID=Q4DQ21_TRYCC|nr:hypothetical protein, conserved [Trypanosoma cruzi]EAN94618.1 hypothetical protein, conserved [Trypanosoma cruzi]PWV04759.1 hypothetical protein C3747_144g114 [Trypanosoma cruzi]RNC46385.1 hypothetical protein TcCL_NonESM03845 [Trypanosoma cruzi]|eukprot:XP_816469.1 hypothetical protein [Trypanosoma cruzi strain CL Brener]